MGAWGAGSFDNDDASDFVAGLESEGVAAITAALEGVTSLDAKDYLEAPEASAAVAAAEVVAAACDGNVTLLPEEARQRVSEHRGSIATPLLLTSARRAVERVLTQSELKDLWQEGGADAQSEAWENGVRGLLGRLEAAKPPPSKKGKAPARRRARKVTLGPGAILRVDLGDRWHTYARILARLPMIAFYDCRVSAAMDDLLAIARRPVLFVLAVSGGAHKGHWPKVGDVPLEAAPVRIPEQFMQDIGTGQCQIVDEAFNARPATPDECVDLERVAVWDTSHVEERLRDHYAGRPNAHLAYMKVKLPGKR